MIKDLDVLSKAHFGELIFNVVLRGHEVVRLINIRSYQPDKREQIKMEAWAGKHVWGSLTHKYG